MEKNLNSKQFVTKKIVSRSVPSRLIWLLKVEWETLDALAYTIDLILGKETLKQEELEDSRTWTNNNNKILMMKRTSRDTQQTHLLCNLFQICWNKTLFLIPGLLCENQFEWWRMNGSDGIVKKFLMRIQPNAWTQLQAKTTFLTLFICQFHEQQLGRTCCVGIFEPSGYQ